MRRSDDYDRLLDEYARELAEDEVAFNAARDEVFEGLVAERAEQLVADDNVPWAPASSLEERARLAAQEQLMQEGVLKEISERLAGEPKWQERLDPKRLARQQAAAITRRLGVSIDDVRPLPDDVDALAAVVAYASARGGVWLVRFDLATREVDKAAFIARIDVAPFDPDDAAVTHTLLAALPVPKLIRRAIETLERDARFVSAFEVFGPRSSPGIPSKKERERIRAAARNAGALRPQRGRKKTPIKFYEDLALDVVEIARQPRAGGVVPELARRRGKGNRPVPMATVKTWLREARKPEIGALAESGWELGPRFADRQDEEEGPEST